jgi:hypothetical protein
MVETDALFGVSATAKTASPTIAAPSQAPEGGRRDKQQKRVGPRTDAVWL